MSRLSALKPKPNSRVSRRFPLREAPQRPVGLIYTDVGKEREQDAVRFATRINRTTILCKPRLATNL